MFSVGTQTGRFLYIGRAATSILYPIVQRVVHEPNPCNVRFQYKRDRYLSAIYLSPMRMAVSAGKDDVETQQNDESPDARQVERRLHCLISVLVLTWLYALRWRSIVATVRQCDAVCCGRATMATCQKVYIAIQYLQFFIILDHCLMVSHSILSSHLRSVSIS